MKKISFIFLVLVVVNQMVLAQEWMTSFPIAKRLALTQNKMLFVMWETSIDYPLPIILLNENGKLIYIDDLFESEELNKVIWDNFVPVLLNESVYDDWYEEIKLNRSYLYKEKFSDDTIKIMDVNGNILSTASINYDPLNFTEFIKRYSLNTTYLEQEYRNYERDKDFYSAFYLGAKYVDFAIYTAKKQRPEIIKLSDIYLGEAQALLDMQNFENKETLRQRLELVRLQQELILNKPKRVLRKLQRKGSSDVEETNRSLQSFLYYCAYKLNKDENNAALWKTEVSSLNLKKAENLINSLKK